MFGTNLVALDPPPAEIPVPGVQIEPVPARDEREGFGGIAAELVGSAGLSGIVPRRRQPAANLPPARLEPANIVSLPAVNRDRHHRECLQRPVDIHAKPGVLLPRHVVRALDPSVAHTSLSTLEAAGGGGENGVHNGGTE